jgi:prepilin-type N-terminal cleavage/methylation domain-containing protein
MKASRASGYTLLELLVTLVLLSVVLGGVFQATERGMDLFRQNSVRGEVNARAGRLIQRVTKELLAVDASTLVPDLIPPAVGPYPGSNTLDFRAAESWAGIVVTGPPMRIAWELEAGELQNDQDDDGDGLVDEGQAVLTRSVGQADELRIVLANGVCEYLAGELPNGLDDNGNGLEDEPGLCFARAGTAILLQVSLERPDGSGSSVVRTQQTSLTLRN